MKKKKRQTLHDKLKKMGYYDSDYMEKFVYINDIKTQYKVRSNGEIISTEYNGKIRNKVLPMSGGLDADGYHIISLTVNGKKITKKIHRLVAEAFIPNPKNKPEVNHKDGNKLNNSVYNLEWSTSSENSQHASMTGLRYGTLDTDVVRRVCELLESNLFSIGEISIITGVSQQNIVKIKNGLIWKNISKEYKVSNYDASIHLDRKSSGRRLAKDVVIKICDDLSNNNGSMSDIANRYNTTISSVRRIYQKEVHHDIVKAYDFSKYVFKTNQYDKKED